MSSFSPFFPLRCKEILHRIWMRSSLLTVAISVNLCGKKSTNQWPAQQGEFSGVEGSLSTISYLNRAATVLSRISCLLMKTPLVHSHKRIQFQQLGQLQRNKCVCLKIPICLPPAVTAVGAVEVLLHLCWKQSWTQSSLQIAGSGGQHPARIVLACFFWCNYVIPYPCDWFVMCCGGRILWSQLPGADLARQLQDKPDSRMLEQWKETLGDK